MVDLQKFVLAGGVLDQFKALPLFEPIFDNWVLCLNLQLELYHRIQVWMQEDHKQYVFFQVKIAPW